MPVSERDVEVKSTAKTATGSAGRHVIAAIGIDRYHHWPSLSNAVRDAKGASALFQRLGFEEITPPLLDDQATGKSIQSLVTDDLKGALDSADSLVLFYAGHGGTQKHRLEGEEIKTGYLIPVDASNSLDKVSTWVDLEAWLRAVSLLPARHILVVLDACHSGIALDPIVKWRDIGSWQDAPLATLQARRSRRIISSALDDQVALDSGPVHGHSLFTGCLLEGLTGGIRGDRGAVTTGSELGLYVQRRVQTYPGARQTPDFGTFAFDDRGEMAIPLAIERAPERPDEPAMAMSSPAWLDLIDLDDPSEPAPGTESRSSTVASGTGAEADRPVPVEPGPTPRIAGRPPPVPRPRRVQPPGASADGAEPASRAEPRRHDLAFDDADTLANATADARARAAAAMEQAWAARKESRRELEGRTGAEVQAARVELAAVARPGTSGTPTTGSAAPAGGTAAPEQRVPDGTDRMPRREQVEPGGQPRQGQPAFQPAVSPVSTVREDYAPQAREIAVGSRADSASGVAGEVAEARSAPGSSPHPSLPSPNRPAAMALTPEPARPSSELVSAPVSRSRRSRRSTPVVPPLSPPTGSAQPAAPTGGAWRWGGIGVGVAALTVELIVSHASSRMDPAADARLHGVAANPPNPPGVDTAPGVPVGVPPDAPSQSPGPPAGDCPVDMVRVPAGSFQMGSPAGVGDTDEHPQHEVTLSAYCIDRTEVTVKAYAACVANNGCTAALLTVQWSGVSAEDVKRYSRFCNHEDRPDHPINCVDWNQAAAYCTSVGKRLPTEAEWEYAARGSDGRAYPWGNEAPSATRLNACGSECVAMAKRELKLDLAGMYNASDRWETTAPVGRFPDGASPFGALDMAGNVWEWTADLYGDYAGTPATNPRGAKTGTARVLRGEAWNLEDAGHVRAADRFWDDASNRLISVGFRCARGD